ncbi:pyruvate, phosphate dikinase [Candidatus Woesearchaeota archaeon]|jgi:pyruvate, orthophosphate dikinase|nr:pyruvate, phosphate dikinase [Candidatus Woesearchaeota archaeon]MBT3538335.1 pyruvate, phosphate dikinase [Candidatus Woesearchaeota archaeon]MBT4698312.1 pyruvate, phosphate dikinase [Candidatus Woesearchaeota archaeon]MBT4716789.1 pyruvate, phosphate dikinase [Candidatus Woesearchaeota archaeon]MBT7106004.1 pyruvate, phosphate dikinase [Candidatus Woesearchaeota archaeon]
MTEKYVYSFDEGDKSMKKLLGGKGANLAEMTTLGIPVPPGFTVTTEACAKYYELGQKYPEGVFEEVREHVKKVEEKMGAVLGGENPLLLSVRSGAAVSMPGMMDTVLNLGLNDKTVQNLIDKTGNERFALDSYRRFIQMFGDVVMGVAHHDFENALEKVKETKGVEFDTDLTAEDLREVISEYKKVVQESAGKMFPEDPFEQLKLSIDAVFSSWNNKRAITYRKLNDIKGLVGTAVNVQAMVFGNMGETSGTGVCFTRDPSTGENVFYGEYLMNAQGEDVVAGIRTPKPISQLEEVMPECYAQLVKIYQDLEKHYKDMQDMEFTIQDGVLYILQTRSGKRTAPAAVRMAVEMVDEGLIDKETALLRVDPNALNQLLHKQLDTIAKDKAEVIAKGLPASPGAAVGKIAFTAERAHEMAEAGETVVLVRTETSPEDIQGMNASQGILTSRGGMTSHAAVVARGMGKCCICGCSDAVIDESSKKLQIKDKTFTEGDWITMDGSAGEVFADKIPVKDPELSGSFGTLIGWADEFRTLKIRTNAETPHDSEVAKGFGAEGIGLCRTEHMFFEGDRVKAVREMILSEDVEGRKKALAKLLPMQKGDFKGIFEVMKGLPVTIRLLDPPLHEFLPHTDAEIKSLAEEMGVTFEKLKEKVDSLHELNPMLGHRGCRLVVTYPEIAEMQTRAIFEAACELAKDGQDIVPEVMIPLVGHMNEFVFNKKIVVETAEKVMEEQGTKLKYMVGTMIEVPRGALTADDIAKEAEFFSFGTNDLTQMTFGFSRDDVGSFVPEYVEQNILENDPFQALDQSGVGQLVKMAVEKGKSSRPDIKLGICGEHGGEPSSIDFCHRVGLDYVSCSPFRVPIARLAAAHAALKNK